MFIVGHEVLYRSKDSALPDLSQANGAGGEVFFDVGFPEWYHVIAIPDVVLYA